MRACTKRNRESPMTKYPVTATARTPRRSDTSPHIGQAIKATISSTKPRVPTMSPTPSLTPIRSVMTKDILLFRKTRKDIENSEIPRRYVAAWRGDVVEENGRYRCRAIVDECPSWKQRSKVQRQTGWKRTLLSQDGAV